MKPKLDEVELSREQSEALTDRIKTDRLTTRDRELLAKLVPVFFWLTLTLRETKINLSRLKAKLFGHPSGNKPKPPPDDDDDSGGGASNGDSSPATSPQSGTPGNNVERRGHGRYSADVYTGAETVRCQHGTLAVGTRCPHCGRGALYALDAAVTIRIDGNALLSAVRYEQERFRCSACTEVFTAPLPGGVGTEKYSPRARVCLALSRYFLGTPFYRLQQMQAMIGVPVADATQWDQVERVADAVRPVFDHLKYLAAQSKLFYHDDTGVRVLSLIAENRSDAPPKRVGMHTTGLVACDDQRTIVLYFCGRSHAGENLASVLALREPNQPLPQVMSDALAANQAGGLPEHIRCNCLSHALRQFTDIEAYFPDECRHVADILRRVYDHDAHTRNQPLDPDQRLHYHQRYSEPIMNELYRWLVGQFDERRVEPNSSLGKALAYLRTHWEKLTQFLRVPGAPLDSNVVERALKLMIRQRNNSLFFASTHSAYVAALLASLIATCAQAQVNVMEYLVSLVDNRSQVLAQPARWLPWNYTLAH